MQIFIYNTDSRPIYEQITSQIKAQILSGQLQQGDALPSMRALAKDLRVSLITTKRAYEDLERDGFLITQPGRGSFISAHSPEQLQQEHLEKLQSHLKEAADLAHALAMPESEFTSLARAIFDDNKKEDTSCQTQS